MIKHYPKCAGVPDADQPPNKEHTKCKVQAPSGLGFDRTLDFPWSYDCLSQALVFRPLSAGFMFENAQVESRLAPNELATKKDD